MISNLEKYKKDLDRLIDEGTRLQLSMIVVFGSDAYHGQLQEMFDLEDVERIKDLEEKLPSFIGDYQMWYSESLILIQQLLSARVQDFVRLYERPKTARAKVTSENYVIEDALHGLGIRRTANVYTSPDAAIVKFTQQLGILRSIERRFESSLFDIKQLVQADVFDSELEAARELNKKGFMRGAGAIAGVVLEGHLGQVCDNHKVKITKKNPTISAYNNALKDADVYDIPTWRKIQHLGDLRNLCDHKDDRDPTSEDVAELIEGVEKVIKTIF